MSVVFSHGEEHMPEVAMDPFEAFFEEALEKGFPRFLGTDRNSTPFNATPYVTDLPRFYEVFADEPGRADLTAALKEVLAEASSLGAEPYVALVGGSFINPAVERPNDLDCALFYRADREGHDALAEGLVALRKSGKARGIDMRFFPVDMEPVILMKIAMYFGALYSGNRPKENGTAGCLLVRC